MITFYGIVEDRNDPLKIGRVRVRCHGIHTDDKAKISTADLPWAQVLLPTTEAAISGVGTQHGLVEGSTVFGFFRDAETRQDPVVTHSAAGMPSTFYKKDKEGKEIERKTSAGFNDPRKLTKGDYAGTNDGVNPEHSPNRSHGLTLAMDTAPVFPKELIMEVGKAVNIVKRKITSSDLPWYPKNTSGTSDLTEYHTGENPNYDDMDISKMDTPDYEGFVAEEYQSIYDKMFKEEHTGSKANPKYPFNKVNRTESGHLIEIDDTKGGERLSWFHRSGTFTEWQPDGSSITRVTKDNYTLICHDDHVQIGGDVAVTIFGKANIVIKESAYIGVLKDATLEVVGTANVISKKEIAVVAPKLSLNAIEIKLNS